MVVVLFEGMAELKLVLRCRGSVEISVYEALCLQKQLLTACLVPNLDKLSLLSDTTV